MTFIAKPLVERLTQSHCFILAIDNTIIVFYYTIVITIENPILGDIEILQISIFFIKLST